jgi:hypothetical protein
LDAHESHLNQEFKDYCLEHKILTLCMPPYSSHVLQLLDVVCFSPLKSKYSQRVCERSVGTVFQLPSPDAIYSRDEEKNDNVGGLPDCLGWRTAHMLPVEGVIKGRKRLGSWPSHVTSGSAHYSVRDLARRRIFYINKEGFLPAFGDAFFDVFTEPDCRKAFEASGLFPINAQVVFVAEQKVDLSLFRCVNSAYAGRIKGLN